MSTTSRSAPPLLLANIFICLALALIGVFAVAKIAFTA